MKTVAFFVVRGESWEICEDKNIKSAEGEPLCGYCDHDERRIVIDKNLESLERIQTIIHEVLHAVSEDVSEAFVENAEWSIVAALHAAGHPLGD
jgi:CMP-N-acetylneuraminic acid synthetase